MLPTTTRTLNCHRYQLLVIHDNLKEKMLVARQFKVHCLANNAKLKTSVTKRYLICLDVKESPSVDAHYMKKETGIFMF